MRTVAPVPSISEPDQAEQHAAPAQEPIQDSEHTDPYEHIQPDGTYGERIENGAGEVKHAARRERNYPRSIEGAPIIALDRSANMIEMARKWNTAHVASGRASFRCAIVHNGSRSHPT